MANPTFPTLSKKPASIDFGIEDPGLKTDMSDGYSVSRARFTRSRFTFTVNYLAMTYADKEAIEDFYRDTIYGSALVFNWTCNDPNSKYYNTVYAVRMTEVPEMTFVKPKWWSVQLVMEEI